MLERFFKKASKNKTVALNIKKVKEKGHQRLTVLMIPHGYDSSFNFQISLFTILFFIFLLFSLISLSVYGIVKSSRTKAQIDELSRIFGTYFDEYIELSSNLEELKDSYSQINDDLNEIYLLTGGKEDELDKLATESDIYDQTVSQLQEEEKNDTRLITGRSYLTETYDYRFLKNEMENQKHVMDTTYNFLNTRSAINQAMPFSKPMFSYHLTSSFGVRRSPTSGVWEYHDGADLANATGTPIYATAPGTVSLVRFAQTGYGHYIILKHDYGLYSLYGHCSKIYVRPGQKVQRGSLIATVGSTGNVTGPHLHYEIWSGDKIRSNPMDFINTGLN